MTLWWWCGVGPRSVHWEGLLTALVGAASAGGLIWAVRLTERLNRPVGHPHCKT